MYVYPHEKGYKACQGYIIELTKNLNQGVCDELLKCNDEELKDECVSKEIRSFINKAAHWIHDQRRRGNSDVWNKHKDQILNGDWYLVDEKTNSYIKTKTSFLFPNQTSLQAYINAMLPKIQREHAREECHLLLKGLDENIQTKLLKYCLNDEWEDFEGRTIKEYNKIIKRVTVWVRDQKSHNTLIWKSYGNTNWFATSPPDTPKQYVYTFPTAAGFEAYIKYGKKSDPKLRNQMQLKIGEYKATKRQGLYEKSRLIFIEKINKLDSTARKILLQHFNCDTNDLANKKVSENLRKVINNAANWARHQIQRNFPAWENYKKSNKNHHNNDWFFTEKVNNEEGRKFVNRIGFKAYINYKIAQIKQKNNKKEHQQECWKIIVKLKQNVRSKLIAHILQRQYNLDPANITKQEQHIIIYKIATWVAPKRKQNPNWILQNKARISYKNSGSKRFPTKKGIYAYIKAKKLNDHLKQTSSHQSDFFKQKKPKSTSPDNTEKITPRKRKRKHPDRDANPKKRKFNKKEEKVENNYSKEIPEFDSFEDLSPHQGIFGFEKTSKTIFENDISGLKNYSFFNNDPFSTTTNQFPESSENPNEDPFEEWDPYHNYGLNL